MYNGICAHRKLSVNELVSYILHRAGLLNTRSVVRPLDLPERGPLNPMELSAAPGVYQSF